MNDLTGKHAIITGGGTGIGAAIATLFANSGAKVTIAGRRLEKLEEHAATHDNIYAVEGDVCKPESIDNMFIRAQEIYGPVDIVIANAGVAKSAALDATDIELWNEMISVNLSGTFLTLKTAKRHLAKNAWGRMICIASTAGLKGYAFTSAYCAAKHGVIGLTRALAIELAKTGITVNAICPGFTQTDLLEQSLENIQKKTGLEEEKARNALKKFNPLGRLIRPDEVANAALWLCSTGSEAITGQTISVSGGETW